MQAIINFFRGNLRLEVAGPFPERFLNICAANGVGFWEVEWLDAHTLRLTVARRDMHRAQELGAKALCAVDICARAGAPFFASRFRRRYGLLVGLTLSLLAVAVLSRVVFTVEITGCDRVPEQTVRAELARLGLKPGCFGPALNVRAIGNQLLLNVEELSWFTVNVHGIRAEVEVRERLPVPELEDVVTPCDIVAARDGLITKIHALNGKALVAPGATVVAGDRLITGFLSYEDEAKSGAIVATQEVRAQGEVWARTWRTLEASTPLHVQVKEYTGKDRTHFALCVLGKRINFYRNSGISYAHYDKITENKPLSLPGDMTLPVSLIAERYQEYTPAQAPVNGDSAETFLKNRLETDLTQLLGTGQAVALSWRTETQGDLLTVTLDAECLEQIGTASDETR